MPVKVLGYDVPTWALIAAPAATLASAYYTYLTWNYGIFKKLGIKGPRPVPLFGTMLPIMRDGMVEGEMPFMKKYGKIFGVYMGREPSLVIADPEILKEIMIKRFHQCPNRFDLVEIDEYITSKFLTTLKDDHWKKVRNLMTPSFSTRKLRVLTIHVRRCAEILVKNLMPTAESGESFEFRDSAGAFACDVIASSGFGLNIDSQNDSNNQFVIHLNKCFDVNFSSPIVILLFFFPHLFQLMHKLRLVTALNTDVRSFFEGIVRQVMEQRSKSQEYGGEPDFIQLMMNAHLEEPEDGATKSDTTHADGATKSDTTHVDGATKSDTTHVDGEGTQKRQGLTAEEIISQSILLILAGYETTANTLAFVGYCLATNPECQETVINEIDRVIGNREVDYDVLKEMTYLDMFLSETLRIYPPAGRMDRVVSETVNINGLVIPKNMQVAVPIYLLQNDPDVWPDPEKFQPERFTPEEKAKRHRFQWMPFGAGPRHCLGMRFALVELKLATIYLLQNFRFKTCEKTPIPMVLDKVRMVAAKGMYLKLEKRTDREL